jgi:hypothetical protein
MKGFIKFLQSNQAVLLAAIMSLTTQLWHSVKAFVMLDVGGPDNKWNYLFGIMFSISTSFAILLFTVRGRKNLAYFFLVVEVFINVIHYGVMDGMENNAVLYSTLFMCIIVPVTIAVYAAEIKDEDVIEQPVSRNVMTTEGMEDREFIEEVNNLIGFDITNPNDSSGKVEEDVKKELRKLWKQRKSMSKLDLKFQMKQILKDGNPLFKGL